MLVVKGKCLKTTGLWERHSEIPYIQNIERTISDCQKVVDALQYSNLLQTEFI